MSSSTKIKERLYYTVENGIYIGRLTNLPCICQAKSLEDLEHKMKIMSLSYLSFMKDVIESDEPFEFRPE